MNSIVNKIFANKIVLITGASSGIGAATAKAFANEGANVSIVGRNIDRLNEVAQHCTQLGSNVLAIKADVSKDEEVDTIVKKTVAKFGKLDVVVNNAGIFKLVNIKAENFLDTFDETMNINIRGPARITRHAVPHLIESKGNIVNISSMTAWSVKQQDLIPYRTSKAALSHFTRSCAFELAEHGIRVNAISPGPVRTNIFDESGIPEEMLREVTALNRISDSSEIADLILYLASDKAKSITGSDYVIDNGALLK